MLRQWETEALRNLQTFKDSNDAFEKRGYANALSSVREVAESLYNVPTTSTDNKLILGEGVENGGREGEESRPEFQY